MTRQLQAILMVAEYPLVGRILSPVINVERETVHFDRIDYGVLSGGERAAIAWAFCIWEDKTPSKDPIIWKEWPGYPMRDPIEGFAVMDRKLQLIVVNALLHRHGFRLAENKS